ncbi:alpha/beta fold hydrolase [Roseateles cellulosilyticus]|uniref:Alpha/beta fold hydrolase n=1 Tax=Pelomonas cellulosilytica TaxID=2906762 RepID=A0ABS8Y0K5_9BURK|nr:alpha/beta fold hydrolase [Pelomonas sp. P8]MCE4556431.1 alpha/beta fold hydrolase [Pelomonas sp. P8]
MTSSETISSTSIGLALATSLLMAACGGGGGGSSGDTVTPAPPPTATDQLLSTTVAGYPHAVNVYRTAGAQRAIVLLHGGGGDLNAVAYQVGLNASATGTTPATINWAWLDANKVVLVVPQGQHIVTNPGATTWSNYAMTSGQDDKGFLQALAAKIRNEYGLADVTLMGHSMGGAMTNRMWCESPATFNRYVSLAGPASATFGQPGTPCAPGVAAPPYMGIIGDSDSVMQTAGAWESMTWNVSPTLVRSSIEAWVNPVVLGEFHQQQARVNQACGESLDASGFTTAGNVDTWTSCSGRMVLRRVRGADHGVASLDAQMGTASALDVMDAVMRFAMAH